MKLMRSNISLIFLLGTLLLQGCAQNESLSPPANSEKIHFTATIPEELEALPISAMYRSKICGKERRTSNMKPYTVPGFQREKYPLTQLSSNQVMGDIPKDGGGRCEWKLSNITFKVKLKYPSKVDTLITENFGFDTIFIIDNNAPQAFDGGYENKVGDLNETVILFPLISDRYLGGHVKQFWLVGKNDNLTYKLKGTNNINLTVDYKSNLKSYWISVKVKTENSMATMIYPNGEKEQTREVFPEFDKLMKIYESSKVK